MVFVFVRFLGVDRPRARIVAGKAILRQLVAVREVQLVALDLRALAAVSSDAPSGPENMVEGSILCELNMIQMHSYDTYGTASNSHRQHWLMPL